MSNESDVQNALRIAARKAGIMLWRNNVGCAVNTTGGFVRYGLANDSRELNMNFKSSDLIGIKPVVVTQDMIGKTVGVFYAREVKAVHWKYRDTKREKAQKAFIDAVNEMGGDAAFFNGNEEIK